jgi:hypothetical protein
MKRSMCWRTARRNPSRPLLRVVGSDAHVDVSTAPDGQIELRVPDYRGNILASADLSTFRETITPGRRLSLDTAIGHLDTFGDGTTQVFRIALNPTARAAAHFYYSDGAIRAAPRLIASTIFSE